MTERQHPQETDEPIIGATYPPSDAPGATATGYDESGYVGAPGPNDDQWYDDDEWVDEYDDPYYEDEYYDAAPARQPLFYVILALALILGIALVFLLFQLFGGNGDETASTPDFNVSINQPLNDERINVESDVDVRILANATEPITSIQLRLDGEVVDEQSFSEVPEDGVYSAILQFRVEEPDTYEISARAISQSGAHADSDPVVIVAVEEIDERPAEIRGEVISNVNARTGPGDEFDAVRTLRSGDRVTAVARSQDSQWLLLEDGSWVRADAIRLAESIELLEVQRAAPTPEPTPEETEEPSPSPTTTPEPDDPDFAPANASLHENGTVLRVTISNTGSSSYSGSLVVRVSGLDRGTQEQVFNVSIGANGTTSVDFMLSPANTTGATVQVTIDPEGAVSEGSEDNNSATFVLAAPVEPPELVISSVSTEGSMVSVGLVNNGGDLSASDITVQISLGGETTERTQNVALANGQSTTIQVTRPSSSGTADVTILANGTPVASSTIELAGSGSPTATPEGDNN